MQEHKGIYNGPLLTQPRLGDPITRPALAYRKRHSSMNQALHWNTILHDDPIHGSASGFMVGVSPIPDEEGCYPLVWVRA